MATLLYKFCPKPRIAGFNPIVNKYCRKLLDGLSFWCDKYSCFSGQGSLNVGDGIGHVTTVVCWLGSCRRLMRFSDEGYELLLKDVFSSHALHIGMGSSIT